MATKQILFNEEARKGILQGAEKVANPVSVSLGIKGKTVVVGTKGYSKITKDGVSIAKSIFLEDAMEAIGANLMKDVAKKTLKDSGDNTTTSVVLAHSILKEGFKLVAAGVNSMQLKKGVDKAVEKVLSLISQRATPIELDSPKLKQIASIAANNDEVIGGFVSDIYQKVGKDSVIAIEESNNGETRIESVDGMQIESGYISPYFMNNIENQSCQLQDAYVLVCEGTISTLKEIQPIFNLASKNQKAIMIVAEEIEAEALLTLVNTKTRGNYPLCVVKAPSFGDKKKEILRDIAITTGATVLNDDAGIRIDLAKITHLGTVSKVLVTRDETTFVGGSGQKIDVDAHIAFVRKSIELSANEYEKRQHESRLARLTGGVGVIYVGAATEVEMGEKKDRYDDSLRATKCAIEEGVIAGGGVAFLRCVEDLNSIECETDDEKAGVKLIQKVLEAPFIQMAKNAGLQDRVSVGDILKGEGNYGYNFKTDKFEDLFESGVVDSAKVIKAALKNASSVSGTLLTSECLIVNVDEPLPNIPQMR